MGACIKPSSYAKHWAGPRMLSDRQGKKNGKATENLGNVAEQRLERLTNSLMEMEIQKGPYCYHSAPIDLGEPRSMEMVQNSGSVPGTYYACKCMDEYLVTMSFYGQDIYHLAME